MKYLYLEPSALFKAYIPEKGSDNVEYVLQLLGKDIMGITSRWTILEITRGIIKRRNIGELTQKEALQIINFFLDDIKEMVTLRKLSLIDVTRKVIQEALNLIIEYNLYAADAVHVKTAEIYGAVAIITDDRHVLKLKNATKISVISVEKHMNEFKLQLHQLIRNKR